MAVTGESNLQVLTMNDAVRSLMGLISRPPEEAALATFLKLDIAQFVEERVRDEFVHLCAHLAHNAMLNGSLEVNPAACQLLVGSVTGTDWAIPVCTTMLEVRLKNGTLSSMSEAEKRYTP